MQHHIIGFNDASICLQQNTKQHMYRNAQFPENDRDSSKVHARLVILQGAVQRRKLFSLESMQHRGPNDTRHLRNTSDQLAALVAGCILKAIKWHQ